MCVAVTLYCVATLSAVGIAVSGYPCPKESSTLDLSGKLGTSTFPTLEQLANIVSKSATNTGIALNLSDNDINDIPSQVLSDPIFQIVVSLDLSGNRLNRLHSGLLDKLRCVRTLDVADNNIEVISGNALRNLSKLQQLYLRNNSLSELPSGLLQAGSMISILDLSHNEISIIGNDTFHKDLVALKEVNLSYNRLVSLEPWPYIPELSNPKIVTFNLQHNQISRLTNNIGWTMTREYFYNVDLRYNKLKYFRIQQFSQYLEGRTPTAYDIGNFGLNLHHNPWYCDCGMYDAVTLSRNSFLESQARTILTCEAPSEFDGKMLGYFFEHPELLICNITDNCPGGCKCEDRPHDKHLLVDCSHSGEYISLPRTVPEGKLFLQMSGNKLKTIDDREYLGNVKKLDVSSNNIINIDNSIIEKAAELEFIDIRNNSLKTLPSKIQKFRLKSVRFTGNPLDCSCDTLWMNDWVRRNSENMSTEALSHLMCNHDERTHRIVDVTWGSLVCFLDIAIGVSVGLGLFLLILIVATVICWRHRYECKVLIYEYLRLHPFDHAPCDKADDATKMYDVYISIDRENDDVRLFVKDKLLKRLEKKSRSHPAYNVYYPCRQDDFGDSIADQMVENINKSRRVLALVNATYLQNGWSIEEFDHANRLMETANTGRLLVLVYGDLDLSCVHVEPLKTYLTQRQCFNLSDKWVWRKLRYELPHRPISNLTSASRESLTSGISSIHATLSESSDLSMSQTEDLNFLTTGVV